MSISVLSARLEKLVDKPPLVGRLVRIKLTISETLSPLAIECD